jgi:hypothetical protein
MLQLQAFVMFYSYVYYANACNYAASCRNDVNDVLTCFRILSVINFSVVNLSANARAWLTIHGINNFLCNDEMHILSIVICL